MYEYIDDLVRRLIEQRIDCDDASSIKRVCNEPTELIFYRTFCKNTNTHFFRTNDGFYGSEFHKKDMTVDIYKCGKHPEIILTTYKISDIIKRFLALAEDVEIFWCKEAERWCAELTCDKGKNRRCGLRLNMEGTNAAI